MYPIWLVEWEAELPGREAPMLRRVKPVRVGAGETRLGDPPFGELSIRCDYFSSF